MQTFLPEPAFSTSAAALDRFRLGKQRVEVLQLLNALKAGPFSGTREVRCIGRNMTIARATPWYNHPACKMWRGWEQSLIDYGLLVCIEWTKRGYNDTCYDKIMDFSDVWPTHPENAFRICPRDDVWLPPWYNETFIHAHRSNLIRKDPTFYKPKWPDVPNDLPYVWPVN